MAASPAPPSLGLTLLLGLLIALGALGMDMFLPSVPAIASGFASEPSQAQLAITSYILGVALGQLAWGPLSDRFGRKPVLLAGLALFALACVAAALATSLGEIVALRFAQGLAMSSGPVIARSVVRDLYAREQAAQLLSRMTVVFGLVPLLAPLLGAELLALGGWMAVFWAFSAIALALVAVVLFALAETAPAERPSIAPARLLAGYGQLLADRRFVAPLVTMLCAQLGIIAFVSNSSLVMIQTLDLTPLAFAVLFSTIMLGQMAGGYAGSRLVHRLGIARMVRLGAAVALAAGLLLATLSLAGATHWSAMVLPMVGFIFGSSFIVPNATAAALTPFPGMAGSASSLLGLLPFGLGALVSAALGSAFDGTSRPLALAIAVFGLLAFISEKTLFRKAGHGPG